MYHDIKKGTVLVYTMVLVVIGVFMATVVLNVAIELSLEFDKRNIEISLQNIIESKGELAIKYSTDLNSNGSGFIDVVSCPQNITMSGSTVLDGDIDTEIRYISGSIVCLGIHNNSENIIFTFNSDLNDLEFVEYLGQQIPISSLNLTGVFGDTDNTFINLGTSGFLGPDGIDDDFNSDNFNISSIGSTYYPDGYIDDDAKARTLSYGYILEDSGLYNMFWSNSRMTEYIDDNTNNDDTIFAKLGDVSSGYLHLDINESHKMILYVIEKSSYNESNELVIEDIVTGTGQLGGIGYLQEDLSLGGTTTNAYDFDFVNNDYALFAENTSSGALLYQIGGEEVLSGSGIYITAIQDDEPGLYSFLGSHILIDDEGRLIGDQVETFGLKSGEGLFSPLNIGGLVAWYDASDVSTITSSSNAVSQWDDKSGNGLNAVQPVSVNQPTTGVSALSGLNVIDFNTDFLELPDLSSYINGGQNRSIVIVHRNDSTGTISLSIGANISLGRYTLRRQGSNARLEFSGGGGTSNLDVASESIFIVRQDGSTLGDINLYRNGGSPYAISGSNSIATDSTSGNFIGARTGSSLYLDGAVQEIIMYDNSISDSDMNLLGNYLADKWGLSWTDL